MFETIIKIQNEVSMFENHNFCLKSLKLNGQVGLIRSSTKLSFFNQSYERVE